MRWLVRLPAIVAGQASRYRASMSRRVVLLLTLSVLSACVWRSYESIVEVHLTVLLQMTDKMCGMGEDGRAPAAADMVEFTYPAQRGRQFLRQFQRYADRSSYKDFGEFLDHYEAMLKRVDAARVNPDSWHAEQPLHLRDRALLSHLAATIRRDLKG